MLHKFKAVWQALPILLVLAAAACNSATATPGAVEANATAPAQLTLKTSMGDFLVASTRLVDEVHGQTAQPGGKFLLVTLKTPDSLNLVAGEFSLEAFQKMIQDNSGKIYVATSNGTQYISTMAGWEGDEFVMGFPVATGEAYTLYWTDNPAMELNPTGQ